MVKAVVGSDFVFDVRRRLRLGCGGKSLPTTTLVIYVSYFPPNPSLSHLRKLLTKSLPTTS